MRSWICLADRQISLEYNLASLMNGEWKLNCIINFTVCNLSKDLGGRICNMQNESNLPCTLKII